MPAVMDAHEPRKPGQVGQSKKPQHVEDAVQQIAEMHRAHKAEANVVERITDYTIALIGTPACFAILAAACAIWVMYNRHSGTGAFEEHTFSILETICAIIGVLLAILILAAQRREDRLATRREQMTLQACLLTEQKVSKVIDLMEELRRDMPDVQNRIDPAADDMKAPANQKETLKSVEAKT